MPKLNLKAQYPLARVVASIQGAVPPEAVLESFLGHDHSTGPHHEAANLHMLTLAPTGPADADRLAIALASGDFANVRAKGFVTSLDKKRTLAQVVGRRWQTSPARDEFAVGIVCLGFKGVLNHADLDKLVTR